MSHKDYYLFIDESGNHGLTEVNTDFPVFILCGVLFESSIYQPFREKVNQIKNGFWGDKEVIFHSRDIRKCQKEFQILLNDEIKSNFYASINEICESTDYTILSSAIKKPDYIKKYGKLSGDVYELCLSHIIERVIFYLEGMKESIKLHIIIEERGKLEDKKLKEHFQRLKARGTGNLTAQRLLRYEMIIVFKNKKDNITGLQLADLVAYPIARYVIDKDRANPAFDLIKNKFYKKKDKVYGLKIYP